MLSPIIGITTFTDVTIKEYPVVLLQRTYVSAIIKANGIPILIPSGLSEDALKELFPKLNGILFSGGGDIAIEYYGGQDHPSNANIDQDRDNLEMFLMQGAIDQNVPFLGICRGLQVLNVVMGGTLYTNIASEKHNPIKHDYYPDYPRNLLAHKVEIKSGNKLSGIFGVSELEVNSLHHQGVKQVAGGLNAIGIAPDGLIEALDLPGHRFGLAVQWHPECLADQHSMQQLFKAFINAARDTIER
jgi:putative glutamine amidotransferase